MLIYREGNFPVRIGLKIKCVCCKKKEKKKRKGRAPDVYQDQILDLLIPLFLRTLVYFGVVMI